MKKAYPAILKSAAALLIIYSVQRVFALSLLSIFPLLAAAIFILLLPDAAKSSNKVTKVSAVISSLFGLLTSVSQYSVVATASSFIVNIVTVIICGLSLGLAAFPIVTAVYNRFEYEGSALVSKKSGVKVFGISMACILAVWTFFFLMFTPGIVGDDAFWQLNQGLGNMQFSNHHPLAHTFIITALYKLGYAVTGTANGAVTTIAAVQMVVLSAAWSFLVSRLYKLGFSKVLWITSIIFFAIAPCNITFAFSVHKDPWFAAAFVVFVTLLFEILLDPDADRSKKLIRNIALGLSALGVGLLRTNGKFALVLLIPFIFIKTYRSIRPQLIMIAASAVAAIIITGPVYNLIGVTPVDTVEYLSIPLQQIARVYTYGGVASAEDDAQVRAFLPADEVATIYNPRVSDNVKNLIRLKGNQEVISDNFGGFLGLWARLLVKNPDTFIEAYVDQTVGFWYPDSSGQHYLTGTIENDFGVVNHPLMPELIRSNLAKWVDATRVSPLTSYLYSNGLVTWLMIFLIGLAVIRDSGALIVAGPSVVLLLTLLVSTPVYSDNRYMYPIFVCLPIFFAMALAGKKKT